MRSNQYFLPAFPYSDLWRKALATLKTVRKDALKSLASGAGLEHLTYYRDDGKPKDMLQVDKEAENRCKTILLDKFGGEENLLVLGEETLWKLPDSLDLSKQSVSFGPGADPIVSNTPETRMTAIVDMIDGSDLLERGFENWCSALVFFRPGPPPLIIASFVHHSNGSIYGADQFSAFFIPSKAGTVPRRLRGPEPRSLEAPPDVGLPAQQMEELKRTPEYARQIAICFYAQKTGHFASIPTAGLTDWLKSVYKGKDRLRIYTLAGNPMMAKLADGEHVHAVFEHSEKGQYAHDMVPGGYIALRAGAHLVDACSQEEIFEDTLASWLLQPAQRHRYALGSTLPIAAQLAAVLKKPGLDAPAAPKSARVAD